MDIQKLREYVEANPKLVTRRESELNPGLFVIKYTRKVFHDALWNDILEECRGLVVDKDWNVVVMPFRKIYNRGERGTDFAPTDVVTAVEKINGFMGAATYVPRLGKVVISTTGSLDSPFVHMARENLYAPLLKYISHFNKPVTWLFEICDPRDPHIIKEIPGPYLIGARDHITGKQYSESVLDNIATMVGVVHRPPWWRMEFQQVVNLVKDVRHEGFVVHNGDRSLKIKSPFYLVTKFLARMKSEKFLERINDPNLKETVDEEFYGLLDYIRHRQAQVAVMTEQQRVNLITRFLNPEPNYETVN